MIVGADSSTAAIGPVGTHVAFQDEWYNLVPYPTGVKFLVTVDESTLATKRSVHPGFPTFHPVAWCQYYNGGRVWVTTLGHNQRATAANSTFPGANQFQSLIVNGIMSAAGLVPFCT